jgi:hypothetical protein
MTQQSGYQNRYKSPGLLQASRVVPDEATAGLIRARSEIGEPDSGVRREARRHPSQEPGPAGRPAGGVPVLLSARRRHQARALPCVSLHGSEAITDSNLPVAFGLFTHGRRRRAGPPPGPGPSAGGAPRKCMRPVGLRRLPVTAVGLAGQSGPDTGGPGPGCASALGR